MCYLTYPGDLLPQSTYLRTATHSAKNQAKYAIASYRAVELRAPQRKEG